MGECSAMGILFGAWRCCWRPPRPRGPQGKQAQIVGGNTVMSPEEAPWSVVHHRGRGRRDDALQRLDHRPGSRADGGALRARRRAAAARRARSRWWAASSTAGSAPTGRAIQVRQVAVGAGPSPLRPGTARLRRGRARPDGAVRRHRARGARDPAGRRRRRLGARLRLGTARRRPAATTGCTRSTRRSSAPTAASTACRRCCAASAAAARPASATAAAALSRRPCPPG